MKTLTIEEMKEIIIKEIAQTNSGSLKRNSDIVYNLKSAKTEELTGTYKFEIETIYSNSFIETCVFTITSYGLFLSVSGSATYHLIETIKTCAGIAWNKINEEYKKANKDGIQ